LDAHTLIRRAEQELADGSRSARKTLERARRECLKERDAEGLEQVLDLAGRLDDGGDLSYATRQNLRFLSRQAQHKPDSPRRVTSGSERVTGSLATVFVALSGAFVGFLLAIPLTYLVARSDNDALVWVAALFFFWFILIPLGTGVALLLLRRSRKRRAHLANPS
jgi:hypothetical protein